MKGKYYFTRCDLCKMHRRVLVTDSEDRKTKTFKFDGCGHERIDAIITDTVSFVKELSDLYVLHKDELVSKPILEKVTETKTQKMDTKWKIILIVIVCVFVGLFIKSLLGI